MTLPTLLRTLAILPVTLASALLGAGPDSSFSEPPTVLYGRILQYGAGPSYTLHRGAMVVTLVSETNPDNRVVLRTGLREVGEASSYSYRLELPQKYLPSIEEKEEHLGVSEAASTFRFESITIDGEEATVLDPSRSILTTSFDRKADHHRLDLRVSIEELDTDGDDMPDWWEDLHGLNRFAASDAEGDLDLDKRSNLDEFLGGTDPTVANTTPLVQTNRLIAPIGGNAGVFLSIVDLDSRPEAILLEVVDVPSQVTVLRSGAALTTGETFSHADLIEGRVSLKVDRAFTEDILELSVRDETSDPQPVEIQIEAFSPWIGRGHRPALWLDAASLGNGAVETWSDQSGNARDAFQPDPGRQPEADDGSVGFSEHRFLYLDLRDLDLTDEPSTVMAVFEGPGHLDSKRTLLQADGLQVAIEGAGAGSRARKLVGGTSQFSVSGQGAETDETRQFSLISTPERGYLKNGGEQHTDSSVSPPLGPLDAFDTLGAVRRIISTTPSDIFFGQLRELIVFDQLVTGGWRERLEDYQLSRWQQAVIWDYRDETIPSILNASASTGANRMNGGWASDTITGGSGPDVIRGGTGDDNLTGGGSGDFFSFNRDPGSEPRITDFSLAQGDVIDLSSIFADAEGSPDEFVSLRTDIAPGSSAVPVAQSVIEIRYDADGGDPDQLVVLEGAPLSGKSLIELVANGDLVLGGLLYPTEVALAIDETTFPGLPIPKEITVTRSGETDAVALDVPLNFGGSATIDEDFTVSGITGSGTIRTVSFAADELQRTITLTPLGTTPAGGDTVNVAVSDEPGFGGNESATLHLTLTETPRLTLQTLTHASRIGPVSGVVEISRTGPLDDPVTLSLTLSGSAIEGVDYLDVPDSITFAPDQAKREIEIMPIADAPPRTDLPVVRVGVGSTPPNLLLTPPGDSTVIIAPTPLETESFSTWASREFPGDLDPQIAYRDDDKDRIINLWEYVHGLNPHLVDPIDSAGLRVRLEDGFLVAETDTLAGLTDVRVWLDGSADLSQWSPANDLDWSVFPKPGDPGIYRNVYRSRQPVGTTPDSLRRFLRLQGEQFSQESP